MKYKIIKVNFPLCEEGRFYRTFAVTYDINLRDFGCAILTAFLSTVKKEFFFRVGIIRYLPESLKRDYYDDEDKPINEYTLEVLPEEFEFCYGVDEYSFMCSVIAVEEREESAQVILLDGAGQAIWENGYFTLLAYFRGDLDSERLEEDFFNDILIPANVKLTKYGDFDTAFNLELMKETFYSLYSFRLELLKEEKNDYMYCDIVTKVINYHREIYEFVERTYQKLILEYSHDDVYLMIYSIFIDIAIGNAEDDVEFDSDRYERKLSELI